MTETTTQVAAPAVAPAEDSAVLPTDQATPPPKPDRIAPNLSVLVRKEQAILKQKQAMAQERAQIQAQMAEAQKWREEREAWQRQQQEFRLNPHKLLEHYGLSFDQLQSFYMNDGKPTPDMHVQAIKSEVEALKAQRLKEEQERQKAQQQAQEAHMKQVETQLRGSIGDFVQKNAETYELIAANGADQVIYDIMEEHYNRTGQLLTIKQSADMLEEHLTEQFKKLQQAKKFQKPPAQEGTTPAAASSPPKSAQPTTSTLTNKSTASTAPSLVSPKIDNDRMARAMAALSRGT